jgi:hypothetical protein
MKILKVIGISLFLIFAIIAIVSLVSSTEYSIEESVVIYAPIDLVKTQAIHFKNFQEWSPWSKLDPNMELQYEGEAGTVGSAYTWNGNKEAGSGRQTITAVADNRVDIDLNFKEPFESDAKTYFTFNEVAGGVEVKWGMSGSMKRPMNLMITMLKKSIRDDYQTGLAALNERCETMASQIEVESQEDQFEEDLNK